MAKTDLIAQRPWRVALLVALLTLAALPFASRLRLATDVATLLPEGAPAAAGYRTFLERFGGLEKVFVLVRPVPGGGADEADLIEAAGLLAELLAASPEVASVRAGLTAADEDFFARFVVPRAPLFLAGDWRREVEGRLEPAAVRARVAQVRASLRAPGGSLRAAFVRSDPLGFGEELLAATPASLPVDPLSSTFLARDGTVALLILSPRRSEMDPEGGRALLAELENAYRATRERIAAPLDFLAVGGPLYAAQDEASLRQDLRATLTGSVLGTTLILLLAFEGVLLPLAALVPLLVALAWTGAFMGLVHGEIAAVSIGFGAVLVGLGIDYGIHTAVRFRQAFLRTPDAASALAEMARHTGLGILTSALTTAGGFATLGLAHFRPLEELGEMVAVGILATLLAVTFLGSALLVLVAPRLRSPGTAWRLLGAAVDRAPALAGRRPRLVLAVTAAVTAVALWGLGSLDVDPDLGALRPDNHPAHEAEKILVESFGLGLDTATVVVHGRDLGQALERTGRVDRLLRQALGEEAHVTSPTDVLVPGPVVEERLRELSRLPFARAADQLEVELRAAGLAPAAFAEGLRALRAFGRGEDPGAPPPEVWPDWLADTLTSDADGTWAAVSLRLPAGLWPAGPPAELVERLRAEVPDLAFASATAIGAELRTLAVRDLEELGLLALLAVAVVVVVSFRGSWRRSLLAASPILLGSVWTLGLWAAAGHSLDLFSLAVLPILLGIGIDDGLHVVHGARREGPAGRPLAAAVRDAGRAILLTTLTTVVGFSSLALSHIPGLRSGGLLIAGGVLACWLATVLVLPAIEAVRGGSEA